MAGPSELVGDGRPPLDELAVVASSAAVGHRTEARASGGQGRHRRLEVVDRERERREAAAVRKRAKRRGADRERARRGPHRSRR